MKQIALFILVFACVSANAQKGKEFQSTWNDNANDVIKTPADKFNYSDKGKYFYQISNNGDNIYLGLKVSDPGVQNRILKEGMTVWISMDTKLSRKMGVRFPIGSQKPGGRNDGNPALPKTNPDGTLATPLQQANTIELIGFPGENARRFPSENADSFTGFVKYDNEGNLFYSMSMPIAKLPLRNTKENAGALPFNFGIEYGFVPERESGRPPEGSSSMTNAPSDGTRGAPRGGGRRGSGGMVPEVGIKNSSSDQNVIPSVLFWVKNVTLATNK